MDLIRIALSVAFSYFLLTMIIDPVAHRCAAWICNPKKQKILPRFFGVLTYWAMRVSVFFVMVWVVITGVLYISGFQNFAQVIGLEAAAKKGKVVMSIPTSKIRSGILLIEPQLLYHTIQGKNFYHLSFRFRISKTDKERSCILKQGQFILQVVSNQRMIEEKYLPVPDEFVVTQKEITGEYYSPQPFELTMLPDYVDLIWEMQSDQGDRWASLTYRIKPQHIFQSL